MQNRSGTMMLRHEADPDFQKLVSLFRDFQQSGGLGVRIEGDREGDRKRTVFVFRRKPDPPVEVQPISEARQLLNLEPGRNEYQVVYGAAQRNRMEIAVLTRSLIEILIELSSYISIPEDHIADGRSFPTFLGQMDKSAEFGPLIEIHNQVDPPQDSFVSVKHRGYHFWISDRINSKICH